MVAVGAGGRLLEAAQNDIIEVSGGPEVQHLHLAIPTRIREQKSMRQLWC